MEWIKIPILILITDFLKLISSEIIYQKFKYLLRRDTVNSNPIKFDSFPGLDGINGERG